MKIKLKLFQIARELFIKHGFKDFDTVMRNLLYSFTAEKNLSLRLNLDLSFSLSKTTESTGIASEMSPIWRQYCAFIDSFRIWPCDLQPFVIPYYIQWYYLGPTLSILLMVGDQLFSGEESATQYSNMTVPAREMKLFQGCKWKFRKIYFHI